MSKKLTDAELHSACAIQIMISREEAIILLEEYLHYKYNVDPLYSSVKAHLPTIEETKYCWLISQCDEQDRNREDKSWNFGGGGGPYFIDKVNSKIYSTGSGPRNWLGNFENYKQGKPSSIDWKAEQNLYLNCKSSIEPQFLYEEINLICRFDEKDKAIEEFFKSDSFNLTPDFPFTLINKPFHYTEGNLLIRKNTTPLDETRNTIYFDFMGGIEIFNFNDVLEDLKKFFRVNKKKESNNYWISIIEDDLKKPVKEWLLRMHLEED